MIDFGNSLAPTDVTLHDFIRMIWQLRIQSIITVTRLFEDGKVMNRRNLPMTSLIDSIAA